MIVMITAARIILALYLSFIEVSHFIAEPVHSFDEPQTITSTSFARSDASKGLLDFALQDVWL